MNKILHVLTTILEFIVAPFNVIIKSNGVGLTSNKWLKAWVIFLVAVLFVVIGIIFYYRSYLFKNKFRYSNNSFLLSITFMKPALAT